MPGLRTVAGPLAGAGGLPPLRFFAANLLGAICYVPWPGLAGYGVGYGLGDWIERLRRAAGLKEDAARFAAILAVAAPAFIAMTWARDRRAARPAVRSDESDISGGLRGRRLDDAGVFQGVLDARCMESRDANWR